MGLRQWIRRHPTAALWLAGAVMLGAGVVIGLALGSALSPPVPTTVPPVALDDAPATETSQRTVVEDEPEAPPQQQASLPPPAAIHPPAVQPAWTKNALPAREAGGRPIIAVIIDDVGLDKKRTARIMQLPGPLTISAMAYADDLDRLVGEARAHGHEAMVHVPMEPLSSDANPGPGALLEGLSREELRKRLADDLDHVGGIVGINNHMGSKFTAFTPGMQVVMEELHRRGLLFIDSLTTDRSVGLSLARRMGVPAAARNVFLDNAGDLASVEAQLTRLEEVARRKGNAIAIGHPRDATIAALGAWLPTLQAKGVVLVPVTAVVKARIAEAVAPR
jgi:hypothetical protein